MTTLNDCIDEAKACLTICQPSSLVSRMNTLTLAQSDSAQPSPQHSPSPIRRAQRNNVSNRPGQPAQREFIQREFT